ncbi:MULTISPECIES: hypothetical protein [unclassified Ruegeria]|uniref:hypothetical protein n=1 Tax=unclassified Ruegeria TaxID=2625375 RepID=UPI0013C2CD7E|nr:MULTISPECIES: hypothetical protein [unclassified Ruegeria]NOD65909.1 hypothetical protein [Ruegeria sp. HKCCD6109]
MLKISVEIDPFNRAPGYVKLTVVELPAGLFRQINLCPQTGRKLRNISRNSW